MQRPCQARPLLLRKWEDIGPFSAPHLTDDDFEVLDSEILGNGYVPQKVNEEFLAIFETAANRRPSNGMRAFCNEMLGDRQNRVA